LADDEEVAGATSAAAEEEKEEAKWETREDTAVEFAFAHSTALGENTIWERNGHY
jgi:hypothetical protein